MRRSGRRRFIGRVSLVAGLTAISCLGVGLEPLSAQQIQRRLPGFQAPARGDLETAMLGRLSATGQYQPSDLPLLARLTVLQSIATLVNVQTDLFYTVVGDRLDAEVTTLWNAAENFYEIVSTAPLDMETLATAQRAFVDLAAAHQDVNSTLGALPAISPRSADHFQSVSRLVSAISSVLPALESDLIESARPIATRSLDLDTMRGQAQQLANELTGLINDVTKSQPGGPKPDAGVVAELNDFLSLVQDFGRIVALDLSPRETQDSFLAARRRMLHAEAKIARLAWPAALERQWRAVRGRMNAISNAFGLPRVIVPAPVAQASARPAAAGNRSLVAHVDHAVAWLDEVLGEVPRDLRQTPAGARFLTQTALMRTQLLQLRRRAIANEPADKLLKSLGEIERMNQQLSVRADELARASHPGLATRYRNPAGAVAKLRSLVAKG